jgi:hypothetical protein
MAGLRWRHFGTGRKTKARGLPQIHSHLGMLSAQLGDKEAARQALCIAAAAAAPFPGQDEARKALTAAPRTTRCWRRCPTSGTS